MHHDFALLEQQDWFCCFKNIEQLVQTTEALNFCESVLKPEA